MNTQATISPLAKAFIDYLDCPCEYFAPMKEDGPIIEAYEQACIDAKAKGYVPMLVVVDETLWECLMFNSDPDNDGADNYGFDKEKVFAYRSSMLNESLPDSKEVLAELIATRKEEAEVDECNWDEEVIGKVADGYEVDTFSSLMHYTGEETREVILAKIPVSKPYEIFAYLPFGNWNECPDTKVLIALCKYWFDQYGATPAALSHDELEFSLEQPLSIEDAIKTAVELYGFCPDCDQNFDCIGQLADTLNKSTFWYLWWD